MTKKLDIYFIALLVCIYVMFSPPFVFSAYIPFAVRVMLEAIPLLLLAIVMNSANNNVFVFKYLFIWSMLVFMMFINSDSALVSVVYSFSKLIFLFSIILIFYNSRFLFHLVRKFWFRIWFFVSVSVIITFFVYQFKIVDFRHLYFGDVSETASYNYYNNIFLGNIIKYRAFDFALPKISWYVFEPGLLAFFLGLNVLIADSTYSYSKHVKKFKALNLIAGFLTFSTTFYIFFIIYFVAKPSSYGPLKKLVLFIVPVLALVLVWYIYSILMDPDIGKFTSIGERTLRFENVLSIINNNTLLTFLFGNGIGISSVVFDRGISSGLMAIFVERGFLILSFLSFIIYKYTRHNKVVLIYVLFYHLTFEPMWYPAFIVAISITYIASRRGEGGAGECRKFRCGE